VTEQAGHGIEGDLDGARITVGSPRWLDAGTLGDRVAGLEEQGMTVVIVHRDGVPVAAIGVRDELRPRSPGGPHPRDPGHRGDHAHRRQRPHRPRPRCAGRDR
jgi:hypothetical protein